MTKQDQDEAKQLDSVTDVVQEKELDASKAQEAMSALSTASASVKDQQAAASQVSKEDVALVIDQLEVTEDVAIRALMEVAGEEKPVVAALRKLITSQ